jgi:zinc-binding alcohol dehydrogenase/oxidoreductase
MKAIVHEGIKGIDGLSYRDFEEIQPKIGEVRVKLKTVGLNHRDLLIINSHKPIDPPVIIGSDGAGVVDAIGSEVLNVQVGDEVMINPGLRWKEKSDAPPEDFETLGHPTHGTYAEYVVIPADNVVPKPEHFSWEEAGVFSLAALTAYRVLFSRGRLQPKMKVLIPGIGSGVATLLLQFAKAAGATVYVTSRSKDKCQKALELGADKAIDSNEDWNKALNGEKMDLVIESIGTATFNKSLDQLRFGGTMVTFGASAGEEVQINIQNFFHKQLTLLGSRMGSVEEYKEMLQFIQKHKIKPILDQTYPIQQYIQAFEHIQSATQFGKIALLIDEDSIE